MTKTGFFSDTKFSSLPLSPVMFTALDKLKFTMTTKIQVRNKGSKRMFFGRTSSSFCSLRLSG